MEPMKLEDWMTDNLHKTDHTTRHAIRPAAEFMRDVLPRVLFPDHKQGDPSHCEVIKTVQHAVELPVYRFSLANEVEISVYNDFGEWHIKVNSPFEINFDPLGLFDATHPADKNYLNVIPDEKHYPPYAQDKRQFSLEFRDNKNDFYQLYALIWIINYAMEHRQQTEEDADHALLST